MDEVVEKCLYQEYKRCRYMTYEQEQILGEAQEKAEEASSRIAWYKEMMQKLVSHARECGFDLEAKFNESHGGLTTISLGSPAPMVVNTR
jgi:hypothetical protein